MFKLIYILISLMLYIAANGHLQKDKNSFGFIFDDQSSILSNVLLDNTENYYRSNETSSYHQKLMLFIEVVICTDYSVYKLHREILRDHLTDAYNDEQQQQKLVTNHIKAYYEQVIDAVNDRYRMSFKNDQDLSIHVNVVDFYISTSPNDSPWSELPKYTLGYDENGNKIINSNDVLIDFNSWLETKRNEFANFDHAFAVTAYDIRGNDTNQDDYNGLGYISGICRPFYSGSLIEEKGAYTSTRSFAHELGHNIGAEHDENTECNEWDNFLMASNFHSYNRNNSWVFSPCSLKSIKDFLTIYDNYGCLLNKPNNNKEFSSYIRLYPGQIYNPFEQCKQLYGINSVPCFEFKSSICETLYCRKHIFDDQCHWIAPAAEGTSCDNGKWCQLGQCIQSYEASSSDCFGDTSIWIESSYKKKSYSCQGGIELLAKQTGKTILEICENYDKLCCKTCERIRTYLASSMTENFIEKNDNDDSKMLKSISEQTTVWMIPYAI